MSIRPQRPALVAEPTRPDLAITDGDPVAVHPRHPLAEKIALVLLSGFLFSIAIASVDIAANYFPPLTLTALRLTTASAIFAGVLCFLRPRYQPSLRGALDIVLVGVLNVGLPFLCLALALRYISSSLAAVLFNMQPALIIAIAHLWLADEKLTPAKLAGTLVAIAGASILVLRGETGLAAAQGQGWLGQLLILLASLAGALGVVYARRQLRHENSVVLAAGQVLACMVTFVTLALVFDGAPVPLSYPWQGWAAMLAATLTAPVLGFWLMFYLVNKYSASLAGFAGITTPLFSVGIGLVFLGEVITLPIALGALLLLAGVWSVDYL